MDGFTYTNIFETKGIEYIAILVFFAFLIPFWIILNRRMKIRKIKASPEGWLSMNSIEVPGGVFFNRNHTWSFLERSGNVKIGIDDLLLHFTGQVLVKDVKKPGSKISKGDIIAEIEQDGRKLKLASPVSGVILEKNASIDPELMYEDPYRSGWIYRIHPENWIEDTKGYYFSDKAMEWSKMELSRFKDFMSSALAEEQPDFPLTVLQDGGEICNNALSALPAPAWDKFQKEFLDI